MTIRHIRNLCVALVLATAASALGQTMDQLRSRTDAGFDAARLATRTSFEALVSYPKDVRDAILTLSARPDLIIKLNEARVAGKTTVDALATPPGADVLSASQVVMARPELLRTLVDRLPVVTLMGQCAGDQLPVIRALLDHEAEARASASGGLVDAWRKRISARAPAMGQLRSAAADFTTSESSLQPLAADTVVLADHPGTAAGGANGDGGVDWTAAIAQRVVKPLPADLGNPSGGFGAAAAGQTPVTGLPGHDEVYFALVHSDKYPELAASIIEQWYYEPNPESFRNAVDAWYTAYQETLPQSLGGQGDMLPGILKERMLFEKRYIAAMRDPTARRMYRAEFLEANIKDFPALGRVRDNEIIARLNETPDRVRGGPVSKSTRSGSGGRSSSGQSSSSTNRSSPGSSSSRGGRSGSLSDVSGMASSSRNTRGNNRSGNSNSNSRFGNSNSNSRSGSGNFGSSSNRNSGFGSSSSGSGFGGSSSGFGGSGSGFGGSGSGSGGSGSGFGSSGSGGSSKFGSNRNSNNN